MLWFRNTLKGKFHRYGKSFFTHCLCKKAIGKQSSETMNNPPASLQCTRCANLQKAKTDATAKTSATKTGKGLPNARKYNQRSPARKVG